MPLVSVIIPAYGHAEYIMQTLDSVFAQTFTDYEIIVVNDGSPDNTAERLAPLVEAGKIRYFEQPNQGVAAARNYGISQASGAYIALLDDDDLWLADKLEWQIRWLESRPCFGIIAGSEIKIGPQCRKEGNQIVKASSEIDRELTPEDLFKGNPIMSPGQALIQRAVAQKLGGFRAEFWGADDYDFWLRAARITRMSFSTRPSLYYRLHDGNASNNYTRMLQSSLAVIRENLSKAPWNKRRSLSASAQRSIFNSLGWRLANDFKTDISKGRFRRAFESLSVLMQTSVCHWLLGWLMLKHILANVRLKTLRRALSFPASGKRGKQE